MPIFDARTWSALSATKVQQQIAVTQYERAIQNAFREVADALAVRGTVDEQLAAQQSLVEASLTETHRLATLRFEKGVDSYLGVLDAQRSLFAAQQGSSPSGWRSRQPGAALRRARRWRRRGAGDHRDNHRNSVKPNPP
jgi:outer membrane protein TolC